VSLREQSRLRRHGINTQATIIEHRIVRRGTAARRRPPFYFVIYRFQHQGKDYTCEQQVSGDRYNALAIGASTTVRYLPSQPVKSTLEHDGVSLAFAIGALAAATILIGIVVLALIMAFSNGSI
jgi:hypothetical protein